MKTLNLYKPAAHIVRNLHFADMSLVSYTRVFNQWYFQNHLRLPGRTVGFAPIPALYLLCWYYFELPEMDNVINYNICNFRNYFRCSCLKRSNIFGGKRMKSSYIKYPIWIYQTREIIG